MQKVQKVVTASLSRQEPVGISQILGGLAMTGGNVQGARGPIWGLGPQITGQSLKLLHQLLNIRAVKFHLTQAARASRRRVPLTTRCKVLRWHRCVPGLLQVHSGRPWRRSRGCQEFHAWTWAQASI